MLSKDIKEQIYESSLIVQAEEGIQDLGRARGHGNGNQRQADDHVENGSLS